MTISKTHFSLLFSFKMTKPNIPVLQINKMNYRSEKYEFNLFFFSCFLLFRVAEPAACNYVCGAEGS